MSIATATRDELRNAYGEAWRKHIAGLPLTPLEAMLVDLIGVHPEVQPLLRDPEAAQGVEAGVAGGTGNPFLHLGLHMAVREQVSIDRPPGIRALLRRLEARCGSAHDAEHVLADALAETLWEAQRSGHPPDEGRYLERVRTRSA